MHDDRGSAFCRSRPTRRLREPRAPRERGQKSCDWEDHENPSRHRDLSFAQRHQSVPVCRAHALSKAAQEKNQEEPHCAEGTGGVPHEGEEDGEEEDEEEDDDDDEGGGEEWREESGEREGLGWCVSMLHTTCRFAFSCDESG